MDGFSGKFLGRARIFTRTALMLVLLVAGAVRADVLLDWNEQALAAILSARQPAPHTVRSMALVHVAVFDAVNAIQGSYTPYRPVAKPPEGTVAEAAVAASAHRVLTQLFPDQKAALDAALATSLAAIADGPGKIAGIEHGVRVAEALLAERATDGTGNLRAYTLQPAGPGVYAAAAPAQFLEWSDSKPWLLTSASQFRPAPPPALDSATWRSDWDETRAIGERSSTRRNAQQTEVARFWVMTGARSWNPIVRQLAQRGDRSMVQNARLFALVYLAGSDALVAVFDAKYNYPFWRPGTAMRFGESADAAWTPLVDAPLHPEYPCAHCISHSAVGKVLEAEFGSGTLDTFTLTSTSLPGVTRQWNRISSYVDEVSDARVWSGVHYRNSALVGADMGRRIGSVAIEGFFKPVK